MKKELYTKRVELFKESFPEYETSKSGNFYAYVGLQTNNQNQTYATGFNTTKNMLNTMGEVTTFNKKHYEVLYLITPRGKLLSKTLKGGFKNLTLTTFNRQQKSKRYETFVDCFFVGRKYEYLKTHPTLWDYRMFQNCNSLNEAKLSLELEFISDKKFAKLFTYTRDLDVISLIVRATNKPNVVALLIDCIDKIQKLKFSNSLLHDWISSLGPHTVKIDFPRSVNRLQRLHDEMIQAQNADKLNNYSTEIKYKSFTSHIENAFIDKGIGYRKLETPRQIYQEGLTRQHCIGASYVDALNYMAFYVIDDLDENRRDKFTLAINSKSGHTNQFYGYRNISPPVELKDLIHSLNVVDEPEMKNGLHVISSNLKSTSFFKHRVVENEILGNYPYIAPVEEYSWVHEPMAVAGNDDDLPF